MPNFLKILCRNCPVYFAADFKKYLCHGPSNCHPQAKGLFIIEICFIGDAVECFERIRGNVHEFYGDSVKLEIIGTLTDITPQPVPLEQKHVHFAGIVQLFYLDMLIAKRGSASFVGPFVTLKIIPAMCKVLLTAPFNMRNALQESEAKLLKLLRKFDVVRHNFKDCFIFYASSRVFEKFYGSMLEALDVSATFYTEPLKNPLPSLLLTICSEKRITSLRVLHTILTAVSTKQIRIPLKEPIATLRKEFPEAVMAKSCPTELLVQGPANIVVAITERLASRRHCLSCSDLKGKYLRRFMETELAAKSLSRSDVDISNEGEIVVYDKEIYEHLDSLEIATFRFSFPCRGLFTCLGNLEKCFDELEKEFNCILAIGEVDTPALDNLYINSSGELVPFTGNSETYENTCIQLSRKDIVDIESDAIVLSVEDNFLLDPKDEMTKLLVNKCGASFMDDFTDEVEGKQNSFCVAVDAGECKAWQFVIFLRMPKYSEGIFESFHDSLEHLKQVIQSLNVSSISMVALGCGRMKYPPIQIANALIGFCINLSLGHTPMQTVVIAIPDEALYGVFAREMGKRIDCSTKNEEGSEGKKTQTSSPFDMEFGNSSNLEVIVVLREMDFSKSKDTLKNKLDALVNQFYNESEIFFPKGLSLDCVAEILDSSRPFLYRHKDRNNDVLHICGEVDAVKKIHEELFGQIKHILKNLAEYVGHSERCSCLRLVNYYSNVSVLPSYFSSGSCRINTLTDMRTHLAGSEFKLVKLDTNSSVYSEVENIFIGSWRKDVTGLGKDSAGLPRGYSVVVTDISVILNPNLWERYAVVRRKLLRQYLEKKKSFPCPSDVLRSLAGGSYVINKYSKLRSELFTEVNENLLFHGATNIERICEEGPDLRLTERAWYGKAVYLADSATKSDQYCDVVADRSSGAQMVGLKMFILQVCLGEIFGASNGKPYERSPCVKCRDTCRLHQPSDSILHSSKNNLFREYIIYDNAHIYPSFVVTYNRVLAT